MATKIKLYLNFNSNYREAFKFYKKAFANSELSQSGSRAHCMIMPFNRDKVECWKGK